jgi:hypothetical protein
MSLLLSNKRTDPGEKKVLVVGGRRTVLLRRPKACACIETQINTSSEDYTAFSGLNENTYQTANLL